MTLERFFKLLEPEMCQPADARQKAPAKRLLSRIGQVTKSPEIDKRNLISQRQRLRIAGIPEYTRPILEHAEQKIQYRDGCAQI